jgi:hypothetical protein
MGDAGVDLLDAGRMICSVNEACSVMWLSPFSLSRQTIAKTNPPTDTPADTPVDRL